jgi:CRP-like cAMP-binding protein
LGPGKYFGEIAFFHHGKSNASVRAMESGPVEVLAIRYEQLHELLAESEVTREALHQAADLHEQENLEWRTRHPAKDNGIFDDHARPTARQV